MPKIESISVYFLYAKELVTIDTFIVNCEFLAFEHETEKFELISLVYRMKGMFIHQIAK